MLKKLFLALIIFMVAATSYSQGVRRIFTPMSDGGVIAESSPTSGWYKQVNAGDTIVLPSYYRYSYFYMGQYSGTADKPIVVINEGQSIITAGLSFKDCSFFKVTGSGVPSLFYGIKVTGLPTNDAGGIAIGFQGNSHDIEVERVDVYKKEYGMWIKQDPQCDTTYNFPNYVINNVNVHDCRFRNIGQDCIYAGNTDPLGKRDMNCNGVIVHFKPARLGNIHLHHLIIDSCNRTGLQLSTAENGFNEIDHCTITRCGFEWNQQQGTGISLGGLTQNTYVHDNIIDQTFLYGILNLGEGTNRIESNTVTNSGLMLTDTTITKDSLLNYVKKVSGYTLAFQGEYLKNTFSQPFNICVSPDYLDTVANPKKDSSLSIIRFNKLGDNANADKNQIGFFNYGKAPYAINQVICSNTKIDGSSATVWLKDTSIKVASCTVPKPEVILPVTLTSFTATRQLQTTVLKWTAAQENAFNRYEVERSANGRNFSQIGAVYPIGTIGSHSYTFTDNYTLSGTNYYRLKMVNTDNSFSYSPIVTVVFESNQRYRVQVFNYLGQLVLELENVNPNDFKASLNSGTYIIRYYNKDAAFTEKLIKQ